MSHDYSEDQLIQKSAAEFMEKELGCDSINHYRDAVYNFIYHQYGEVA